MLTCMLICSDFRVEIKAIVHNRLWLRCTTHEKYTVMIEIHISRAIGPITQRHDIIRKLEVHNIIRGRLSHGHRQRAQKIWRNSAVWFSRYAGKQTDN